MQPVLPPGPLAVELKRVAQLAAPVVVGSIGLMAMGTVDTLMVGRLGRDALAALAIANIWGGAVSIPPLLLLAAMDPVISQATGAGDRPRVGQGLREGLGAALLLSLPMIALLLVAEPALRLLGQPAEIIPLAGDYCRALVPGAPAFLLFAALRNYFNGQGLMRPPTVATLLANLVNVALNYVFIFGVGGLAGLGVMGSGLATAGSRWAMVLLLVWAGWPVIGATRPARGYWPQLTESLRLVGLGLPLGAQGALEVWAFTATGLMMGWLGATASASNAILLTVASLTFMVPMGISAAAATRVGNLIGAGHRWGRSAAASIALGASAMAISALILMLVPERVSAPFTESADVLALTATLLPVVGAFQVFDGVQVVSFGALRGAGDLRVPMIANVIGYWVAGLPLGAWLAFRRGWGATGIWAGLALGLALVAGLLCLRLLWVARRGAVRLEGGTDAAGAGSNG